MAMKIQYPTATISVITPTMIPAAARPRPRSPVSAILRRAAAPSQIPAIDPSPPSVRIDRTRDQIAILLRRLAVGDPYSGARVAVSCVDMVVHLLLDDIPRGPSRLAGNDVTFLRQSQGRTPFNTRTGGRRFRAAGGGAAKGPNRPERVPAGLALVRPPDCGHQ